MRAPAEPRAIHTIATPTPRSGAIAVVSVHSDRMDEVLGSLGLPRVEVGGMRLAGLLGVDEGLVVRWSQTRVDLTPHAGRRVVRALSEALIDRAVPSVHEFDPREMYPEAGSDLEARMLAALARAPSPRAIDLLLDQPRRWASLDEATPDDRLADGRALGRLLDPPLVVAVGAPNVGKSTLVNALAGRQVSIVADEPGVTRDAVGVVLELDGLCVRYLDAPGLATEAGEGLDARARDAAMAHLAQADLVLSCHDATAAPVALGALPIPPGAGAISVNTRSDLGNPHAGADLRVSVARPQGLDELARAVRHRLVPDEVLDDPRPWRFWA